MNVTLRKLLYDEDFIAKLYGWSYNHTYERTDNIEEAIAQGIYSVRL